MVTTLKAFLFHVLDLQHIGVCQDRIVDFKYLAVLRILNKKVSVFSYVYTCGSNDLLTDGIDRRVCYLCKQLFEIVEQWIMLFGKYCKRGIMPIAPMLSEPFNAMLRMEVRYCS